MKTIYKGHILGSGWQEYAAMEVTDDRVTALWKTCPHSLPTCDRLADCEDFWIAPAFLDAHSHLTAYAGTLGLAQLEGATTQAEIIRRLNDFATTPPARESAVLCGYGYDNNLLPQGQHPTRQALDKAFGSKPVLITHRSGHMGVANTAALALLGIQSDTPDPPGGVIGRDLDGTLTGYLEETAFTGLAAQLPAPSQKARCQTLCQAQQRYASNGIVTVQEGLTGQKEWQQLADLCAHGDLILDVIAYADIQKSPQLFEQHQGKIYKSSGGGSLVMGGYKLFLDGSPQGRTAWMTRPYAGDQDYRGYPIHTDKEVEAFVRLAAGQKAQLLCHCNGDAAADQFLHACQRVFGDKGCGNLRFVMIHAQLVRYDQLGQMKKLGILPSFFVAHVFYWGETHLRNFGTERAAQISPAASAKQCGLAFTFHQDTPVLEPDMLFSLRCATTRKTNTGRVLGKDEQISATDALDAMTKNVALQYHLEHSQGQLDVGYRADFILLSGDPRTPAFFAPNNSQKLEILETYKAGKLIWSARQDSSDPTAVHPGQMK